jgi:two-component system LytT family sensor kinase
MAQLCQQVCAAKPAHFPGKFTDTVLLPEHTRQLFLQQLFFCCAAVFCLPPLYARRPLSVLTLAGIILLRYLLEYHVFIPLFHFDNYRGHRWPVTDYIENVFFYYFPKYFIYGLLYFFAERWYRDKQLKQELQREKSAAELAFLRSQINPHFLFNTINDIYSLTYQRSARTRSLAEVVRAVALYAAGG